MTNLQTYLDQINRLSPRKPLDLDQVLFEPKPSPDPMEIDPGIPTPPKELWDRHDDGLSFIGIRITRPIEDEIALALKLAAAAAERGVIPIILTKTNSASLRRFGFRVEDISADTEELTEVLEEQVAAFWSLAIIVDASQVSALG